MNLIFVESDLQPSCSEMAYKIQADDKTMKKVAKKMIKCWVDSKTKNTDIIEALDYKDAVSNAKEFIKSLEFGVDGKSFEHTCNYPTQFIKIGEGDYKILTCNNESEAWDSFESWMSDNGISWSPTDYDGDDEE